MRRFRSALRITAAFLAAAALTGCLFGDASDDGAPPGELVLESGYTVKGDTLIVLPYTILDVHCAGEELIRRTDSVEADTVVFRITGSKLSVFSSDDTTFSGAVVRSAFLFMREGSGSGLMGLWAAAGREFIVLSGTPDETDMAEYEENRVNDSLRRIDTQSWVRFTGGRITSFENTNYSARFIRAWTYDAGGILPSGTLYAIDVNAIDRFTVELKGRTTGETVRITQKSRHDITYTSSLAGHPAHYYFRPPVSCPNSREPDWLYEFKQANPTLAGSLP